MPEPDSIKLSINVNKVALIRNSREGDNPNLPVSAQKLVDAGAHGITVHPRPDQRHIRPEDCTALANLVTKNKIHNSALEFNIEGNPFAEFTSANRSDFSDYPGFIAIVEACLPDQATLVPDSNQQLTSDHGFDLNSDTTQLKNLIEKIKQLGPRVSLFMDPDTEQIKRAAEIGADRIELYTGPFAHAFPTPEDAKKIFDQHCQAAETANACGLEINAGHDLNLQNLTQYKQLPYLKEVSIGHAFTIDSLDQGLVATVRHYLNALQP